MSIVDREPCASFNVVRGFNVVRVVGAILLASIPVACSGTEPSPDVPRANRGSDAGDAELDDSSSASDSAETGDERLDRDQTQEETATGADGELDARGDAGKYFFGDSGVECADPADYDPTCSDDSDCALVPTCVGQDPYAYPNAHCAPLAAISRTGPKGLAQWQADAARNGARLTEAGAPGLVPPACLPPMFARCVAGSCVAK